MDCCSSTNYVDYRHHSMNGNYCYPYTPSMLRSAGGSPYPMGGGPGMTQTSRYGADYRSSALGYHGAAMGYDGYEKYYGGGYGPGYGAGSYYGNYSPSSSSSPSASSYREYGGGYSHYYHQSQSPYARAGGPGPPTPYGGGSPSTGGYLYPGRPYPFGGRESYYHAQREHHQQHHQQQQQYSSFSNYGHLAPYRGGSGTHPEHPGGKSHHHPAAPPQQQHQEQYPQPFAGSHTERRPLTGGGAVTANTTPTVDTHHPSPVSPSLFSAQNGFSSPGSADYTTLPPSTVYGSDGSPQHHPQQQQQETPGGDDAHRDAPTSNATPTPTTVALHGATADFPHGTKDTRMRKPKERKLHRGGGRSPTGSPTTTGTAGGAGYNGASATATRMKSLDALTSLCWPDEEQFPSRMRKYSTANGPMKAKESVNGRKESNELDSGNGTASPNRGTGGRRTKKQPTNGKQSKEAKSPNDAREKQVNGTTVTAPVENKNVTPLPGFQQAFGSTEIGKFSEVFFNASPTSGSETSPPHHHPLQQQSQPQQPQPARQQQQQQPPAPSQQDARQHQQHSQARPPNGTIQQLVMETLSAYDESDVDTLSPGPWDPSAAAAAAAGPAGDGYETGTGYNLPPLGAGTFHPSYYESSSYSDHAVDSPLGNYFSEMTCNEFVN